MKKDADEHPDVRDVKGKVCGKGCGAFMPILGMILS